LPRAPSTFAVAKKALYDRVYFDHRITFDCGCAHDPTGESIWPVAG
jgi:endonuclease I